MQNYWFESFHKLKSYLYDQKYSYSDRKNIGFL